jgi:hypothetical protein
MWPKKMHRKIITALVFAFLLVSQDVGAAEFEESNRRDPFVDLDKVRDQILEQKRLAEEERRAAQIESERLERERLERERRLREEGRPVPAAPVTPTAAPPPSFPSLRLQGLVWNTVMPQAVVDGEVIVVGDVVQGATVKSINKLGVGFELHGYDFFVNAEGSS